MSIRVSCYIDGFNIYHAIDDASRAAKRSKEHLKWINLWALMECFTDPNIHKIQSVKLFTAYPFWNPDRVERHKQYVKATTHFGTEVIMGQFKRKDSYCKLCKGTHQAHEEKESDVNIAMHLINDAHNDVFDQAFLITNDSDLLGPVRLLRQSISNKKIKIIAPPFRRHSKELWAAADNRAQIQEIHLEKSIMPESIVDAEGRRVFQRPINYSPQK